MAASEKYWVAWWMKRSLEQKNEEVFKMKFHADWWYDADDSDVDEDEGESSSDEKP